MIFLLTMILQYIELRCLSDTSKSPKQISVGDIVEAQLTIMAIPTVMPPGASDQHFKLALVLRSLALIDNTFSRVSLQYMIFIIKYMSNVSVV
jgi:hypothetical protein